VSDQAIRVQLTAFDNGVAERLIGSIRRECVDHIIVLGEMHLRRVLKSYADYYNSFRTHRSLNKDAPISRPVLRTGVISSPTILGGLHHHLYEAEFKFSVHTGSNAENVRRCTGWDASRGGTPNCLSCGNKACGRRLGSKSRMTRERHVRFREGGRVRFPSATRLSEEVHHLVGP
jgi:Integrase core domain